jgi:hypothetical protein
MAPPRKPAEPGRGHPIHVRLPTDIFDRVDAKAKAEGRPMNRIIINELAAFPHLDRQAKLGDHVRDLGVLLARYGARVTQVDLGEDLLRALDAALGARTDGALQPSLDRLRVIRAAMLESEQQVARTEREQLAGQIKMLELKIAAIAALPDSALDRDNLPSLRDELARLQRAAVVAADGK